ncbi:sigma-70 family RNA polymerase sigma factor [Candidatus Uabimicrobium amorphum]|uniref:DNA-directed RNA polymerase sigma-70 factor n=1 Tax=Uabimicrobium amorphum TaxID=2596890 RepID=A0A5S9IP24_UABAM|nr:FliA/WhiG family RNA polymerase sigma factor [Candidatus Uabimicrobium amorphum]BBM85006.1 DNA-directed RNA polymerase sigma-70 factor [Candidatus Uabimicrobium amorphum]
MLTYNQKQINDRDKTIENFLPLVRYVVGRMSINIPSFLDVEDFIEVGIIGLISAVDSYNPTLGSSLKTYAYTKIRGAILDELRKTSFFSRNFSDKLKLFRREYNELHEKYGYPPALEELSERLEMSYDEISELLVALRGITFLSIDQDANSEDNAFLSILTNPRGDDPSKSAEKKELEEQLALAISKLPEREHQVVTLYYYQGLMLKEISEVLGVSPSRISHLHSRAIYQLNQYLRKENSQ